jgi:hypothetical protein
MLRLPLTYSTWAPIMYPQQHARSFGRPRKAEREDLRVEYEQLGENMRHYANVRFAQLTLFFLLTSGLIALSYKPGSQDQASKSDHVHGSQAGALQSAFAEHDSGSTNGTRTLCFLGALSALAFLLMEERASDWWHHFQERAHQIEERLGMRQFHTTPKAEELHVLLALRSSSWFRSVCDCIRKACGGLSSYWRGFDTLRNAPGWSCSWLTATNAARSVYWVGAISWGFATHLILGFSISVFAIVLFLSWFFHRE